MDGPFLAIGFILSNLVVCGMHLMVGLEATAAIVVCGMFVSPITKTISRICQGRSKDRNNCCFLGLKILDLLIFIAQA